MSASFPAILRRILLASSLLATPASSARAELQDLFEDLIGGVAATARPLQYQRITEPPRPFRIGRDNLAFKNPSGAIRIQGMSGNCYAMAVVAKLFHQAVDFRSWRPAGVEPGLDPARFAALLRRGPVGSARMTVHGYPSLHAMTSVGDANGARLKNWVQETTRAELGAAPPPSLGGSEQEESDLLSAYRLVSSVHYLQYLQDQGSLYLEELLGEALGDSRAPKAVTRAMLDQARAGVASGDLPVLLIFNHSQAYGHVVLGYRMVETATHSDLYLYDSNRQQGTQGYQSLLRVDRTTGSFSTWRVDEGDDEPRPDPSWERHSWWDADGQVLLVIPDSTATGSQRFDMARKIQDAGRNTAMLVAAGEALRSLTTRSPAESSLRQDLAIMIRGLRTALLRHQPGASWIPPPLGEDPSAAELNSHLSGNLGPGAGLLVPLVLPEGIGVEELEIRFDERDPNRARVDATLELEDLGLVAKGRQALARSALFAEDQRLGELLGSLAEAFEGERVTARLSMDVTKGRSRLAKLGEFGPRARLVGSRVILGRVAEASLEEPRGDHEVVISEAVLQRFSDRILREAGVVGAELREEFEVNARFFRVRREGRAQLTALVPRLEPGLLRFEARGYAFMPVVTETRGIAYATRDAVVEVGLERIVPERHSSRHLYKVSVSAHSSASVHAGLGALDHLLVGILTRAGRGFIEGFVERLEGSLEAGVEGYLELPAGEGIVVSDLSISRDELDLTVRPFRIDTRPLGPRLLGSGIRARLEEIRIGQGFLALSFDGS